MLAGLVNHQGIYNRLDDEREWARVARRAFEAYRLTYGKGWLTYWFRRWRSRRHTKGKKATDRQATPAEIEFIGVWDTVEAYGLPVTELARWWDRLVLPLRFVRRSVPENVMRACHALSIDEERHSFHPVLWDESGGRAHIEQVWFAGSHADVGGGYPRHELALVPLDWMISKVEPTRGRRNGLHFRPAIREEHRHRSDWHGMQHDSRAGLAAYYRYRPRSVEDLSAAACVQADGVMVHRGVLERIRQGAVPYAPTAVPEEYRLVDTPRGRSGRPCRRSDYESSKQAARRMARMAAADDMVFLRRWLYAGFLLATLFALASMISDPAPWMTPSLLNGRWIVATVAAAVLSFLKYWAEKATQSRAASAWSLSKRGGVPPRGAITPLRRFFQGPRVRRLASASLSAILILGLFFLLTSLTSRAVISVRAELRPLCEPTPVKELREGGPATFSVDDPCAATGIKLREGQVYRISVVAGPWHDGLWESGPGGHSSPFLLLAAPNRRHPSEPWFKLMGQVGPDGREVVSIGSGPVRYRSNSHGELFLYVNDAVLGVPWGDWWSWPYRWRLGKNSGEATVTVSSVQ